MLAGTGSRFLTRGSCWERGEAAPLPVSGEISISDMGSKGGGDKVRYDAQFASYGHGKKKCR